MNPLRLRILPVLGLYLLAPWMAEFSWGGLGLTDMVVGLLYPLYGCAALLVREVARRTGRGWPTMLLLAGAFGVLQAGVVDQSMFNPHYLDFDFTQPAHVPGLGISGIYALSFVVGHVVVSMAVPIALVETYAVRLGPRPWLGRVGLTVVALLYVLAAAANYVDVKENYGHGFQAAPAQTGFAVALVLVLVLLALTRRPGTQPVTGGTAPAPWLVALGAFLAYQFWLPHESWAGVAVAVVVLPVAALTLTRWSRRAGWGPWHRFAAAAGVALVGPITAFTSDPYEEVAASTELLNDAIATLIPLLLVAAGWWTLRATGPRVAHGAARSAVPSDG
ncbi:hypothetical protein [Ornithinicoccus hortensis]|uniref:Uncharacterized protein n=1 Tax=Ornithinicoccus hortensis TaxID=82346 RepID=A0A542YWD2_9MICO|nr:hypothetical protein [Ornithinicoccus hortensis]TQL52409.1 hypothetical protein FB467_3595 [Ornithinicoccus hortensis]